MFRLFLLLFLLFTVLSCSPDIKKNLVTTSAPLQDIVSEIAGKRHKVINLLPPGVSPHTYQPKPSDVKTAANSLLLFYISDEFDGWVAGLNARIKTAVFDLVPDSLKIEWQNNNHTHNFNPHFWLDPLAVKSVLTGIAEKLAEADPEGKEIFYKNAAVFGRKIDQLHKELTEILSSVKGKSVITFHPSFNYMTKRYGLKYLASIEPFPGKEPTANDINKLAELIKANNVKAVFSEIQLPENPANVISGETGIPVYKLDPLGGTKETKGYMKMMIHNAKILRKALSGGKLK